MESIIKLCQEYKIDCYEIIDDSIDVYGSVYINRTDLKKLPIKFRNVYGDFNCYLNKLTTLENSPIRVSGDFICSHNNLTDLKYSAQLILGDFYCQVNYIISIEDFTTDLEGEFYSDITQDPGLIYSDDIYPKRILNHKEYLIQLNRQKKIENILKQETKF
jgi:hypothetical protein